MPPVRGPWSLQQAPDLEVAERDVQDIEGGQDNSVLDVQASTEQLERSISDLRAVISTVMFVVSSMGEQQSLDKWKKQERPIQETSECSASRQDVEDVLEVDRSQETVALEEEMSEQTLKLRTVSSQATRQMMVNDVEKLCLGLPAARTKVTFAADLSRLGLTRLEDHMVRHIRKHTYEWAGQLGGREQKVCFNGAVCLGPQGPEKPNFCKLLNLQHAKVCEDMTITMDHRDFMSTACSVEDFSMSQPSSAQNSPLIRSGLDDHVAIPGIRLSLSKEAVPLTDVTLKGVEQSPEKTIFCCVFPLRGNLTNVRHDAIAEIPKFNRILGLQHVKVYLDGAGVQIDTLARCLQRGEVHIVYDTELFQIYNDLEDDDSLFQDDPSNLIKTVLKRELFFRMERYMYRKGFL
ncbi:hypothetical protein BSKO_00116 [Bryopsis sp. KO-2023]|nr:hypothetical protein BSKO_00116 [Bryopsis sp. KO-2023]